MTMHLLIILWLCIIAQTAFVDAFCQSQQMFGIPHSRGTRNDSKIVRFAWSIPTPTDAFGSWTPSPTWYDQVDNPTARRMIYDDLAVEFNFEKQQRITKISPAALSSEGSSSVLAKSDAALTMEQQRRRQRQQKRVNPLRRAIRWVSRRQ
eukprot:CAMPEP_0119550714 /NCGR_PEP_ID=MMETSP1352-20130426/4177_1 /TAXON_ID=265584 /ORGANISM="Stauroneis constricta, Strain CCMP1120" /LENGTH=149 /DNA_ID=CAMNT_0007596653 /DNA_START=206 /DNA_END=655 /DNA_ORIENTATION=-